MTIRPRGLLYVWLSIYLSLIFVLFCLVVPKKSLSGYCYHRYLEKGGFYREWPEARGVYMNSDKTIIIWANEEDHLRVTSLESGANINSVYNKANRVSVLVPAVRGGCGDHCGEVPHLPPPLFLEPFLHTIRVPVCFTSPLALHIQRTHFPLELCNMRSVPSSVYFTPVKPYSTDFAIHRKEWNLILVA